MGVNAQTTQLYGDVERAADAWRRFLKADSLHDAADVASQYGWLAPVSGVLVYALTRGFVTYVSDPLVIKEGYVFPGWMGALFVNVLYAFFLSGLIWFFVFGTIGAVAGLLAPSRGMNPDVFKVGGYLAVLFVPISIVSFGLALTVSAGDIGVANIAGSTVKEVGPKLMESQVAMRATEQMTLVRLLRVSGWLIAVALVRPMLEELYDIGRIRSTVAVIPSTLAAVLGALLL